MMRPAKDLNNGPIFSKCCALLTEGGVRTPYLDQMGSKWPYNTPYGGFRKFSFFLTFWDHFCWWPPKFWKIRSQKYSKKAKIIEKSFFNVFCIIVPAVSSNTWGGCWRWLEPLETCFWGLKNVKLRYVMRSLNSGIDYIEHNLQSTMVVEHG